MSATCGQSVRRSTAVQHAARLHLCPPPRCPRGVRPPGAQEGPRLEAIGEALADYDAAVGGALGQVHVHLSLQAASVLDAGQRAVDLLDRGGLPAGSGTQLEVIDEPEAERRLATPVLPAVAGGKEAADLLGVSRQRLHQLIGRPDFPEPDIRLASGPVRLVASLRSFERSWPRKAGRPGRADTVVTGRPLT